LDYQTIVFDMNMDDLSRSETVIIEPISGKVENGNFTGNTVILSLPVSRMEFNNTN